MGWEADGALVVASFVARRRRSGEGLKVVVHIGDGKCGSSSVQASLYMAAASLLEQGILYHAPAKTAGHFSYITLLNGSTRSDDRHQAEIANASVAETRELVARHGPSALVISGESLFHIPPHKILDLLQRMTGDTAIELHVLAYLRHPVPLYLSRVQQELKGSAKFTPPLHYRRDFVSTFDRWLVEPACATLTARLFDRRSLVGGSVVTDFADYLHRVVGLPQVALSDVNENSSLSEEQMILLQRLRRDFLPDDDDRLLPPSNNLVRFLGGLNAAVGRIGTAATLRPQVGACIAERNATMVARIDAHFPELGMAASYIPPSVPWQDAVDGWTDDVASILMPHDKTVVDGLTALVPEYNSDLAKGDVGAALNSLAQLSPDPEALRVFFRYMVACGHTAAAEATREAIRAAARAARKAARAG